MSSIPPPRTWPGRRRHLVGAVTVAVLAAALWYAWMGWDTEYQTDPVTQVSSGPYQAWQVIGCVLSLLVLLVGALLARVSAPIASVALSLGFALAWTATASSDSTGLYLVGAILVLFGTALGSTVVSLIVLGLRRLRTG